MVIATEQKITEVSVKTFSNLKNIVVFLEFILVSVYDQEYLFSIMLS